MLTFHEASPHIVWMGRSIKTLLAKPEIIGPVLGPSTPADGRGASIYGSVLHDGGTFRMWYQAWPEDWEAKTDVATIGYAESDDGLEWRKPKLGLVEFAGSKDNNLVPMPLGSPSVFIDPNAPASHRYRATGFSKPAYKGVTLREAGYYTAHSSDGIHWQMDQNSPRWSGQDVIMSCWDPYNNCGHVVLKRMERFGGINRRTFHTAILENGEYSDAESALVPDDYDDIRARESGAIAADYYGMGWVPQRDLTYGVLWNLRIDAPLSSSDLDNYRPVGLFGQVDLSVVWRDTPHGAWRHLPGRPTLLAAGDPDTWYGGCIYTAASVTRVGDEEWMYFSGTPLRHGDHLSPHWKPDAHRFDVANRNKMHSQIGVLHWKSGRLTGLHASLYEEIRMFPPHPKSGESFFLNAKTRSGGSIRAELLSLKDNKPLPGYSLEQCVPFTGDHIRAPLRWKNHAELPLQENQKWIMRLCLERATVYGFDVAPQ